MSIKLIYANFIDIYQLFEYINKIDIKEFYNSANERASFLN